ncbi:NADPH:quinone oxidoreductase family protein [Pseudonocardiaceae bacterium YIM PH 21723]|nr:NADPH:quinone oxidoreductase family protein [Pseudonocardiaceae bacterium YIM PH 21723]
MRAIQIQQLTGPDGVAEVTAPQPEWGDWAVLIKVTAALVSFPDLLQTRGLYQMKPPLPYVPGGEVIGVVEQAREGGPFQVGQRVAAVTGLGGWAEYALAVEGNVVALPDELPDESAVGVLFNYETAIFALDFRGRLVSGETVLVHGAAGGLGSACVQVAKALGARVIAAVSSEEKAAVAREAGADEVVLTSGDWLAEVKGLTGGNGVDVIADPVGADLFKDSLRSLARGGRLLVLGFAGGSIPEVAVNRLLLRNVSVLGVAWGEWFMADPTLNAKLWDKLLPLIKDGKVKPRAGQSFPLDRAVDALRLLDERKAVGQVSLRF